MSHQANTTLIEAYEECLLLRGACQHGEICPVRDLILTDNKPEYISGCCGASYYTPHEEKIGAEVLCLSCKEYSELTIAGI